MPTTTPKPRRELITAQEAAARLGVHERTIRRRIAAGLLPGYHIGSRALRVDAADLDALLTPARPLAGGTYGAGA